MKRLGIDHSPAVGPLRLRLRPSAWLIGVLALAGCSWFADPEERPAVACPPAFVLDGAGRVVRYAPGQERAGSAIRYIAAISAPEADCRSAGAGLEVDLRFVVALEAGPAYQDEPVVLDLFVASVVDDRLTARRPLEVRLVPDGGRARRLEMVTIGLAGAPASGRIYLGLELAPEEREERLRRRRH